jgi:hypothetical protein
MNRFVGETTRALVGDEALASASDSQLRWGTFFAAAGIVAGGYAALSSLGVVGGAAAAAAGTSVLSAAGSFVTYASLGFSASRLAFTGNGADDLLSDSVSLLADVAARRFTGPVRGAALAFDFVANAYQGGKSAAHSYDAFRQDDYVGGTLNAIGAGLGFAAAGIRGAELTGDIIGSISKSGVPALYWHASPEGVAAAQANGLFAHGPGAGGKFWATTIGTPGRLTEVLVGGNHNIDSLIPFRMSTKGGFGAVYRLTTEEASRFSRAWGFRYSWNPYQWYKGAIGQYFVHPGSVSWGQRGIEVVRGGTITVIVAAGTWAGLELKDWWDSQ